MYTAAAVQRALPRGCQSRAELTHCLACAAPSEAQGSGESREACITPSEVDKVHQWPIYSTVQYQASSPPANTQWRHERLFVSVCVWEREGVSCQSKQNWHAHSGTFSHGEEVSNFIVPYGHKAGENILRCILPWKGSSWLLSSLIKCITWRYCQTKVMKKDPERGKITGKLHSVPFSSSGMFNKCCGST